MNRWDTIQAAARDIASNVHADPEARNAMADDLIKLCCLIVDAVGKGVAIDGESSMANADDETSYARYTTGEQMQTEAKRVIEEASSVGADLERYERPDPLGNALNPPVWQHVDRRPEALQYAAVLASQTDPFRNTDGPEDVRCDDCGSVERLNHAPDCNRRCSECNRTERFEHKVGCSKRDAGCVECGRRDGHKLDCSTGRRTCCHDDVARCPWSGLKMDGCCHPISEVCPKHH